MTISKKQEADILRYFHSEKWKVGTISRQLNVHHNTVHRVLAQSGVSRDQRITRRSMVDNYIPFIIDTLTKFPKLTAARLYAMVRERGYKGGEDYFRHVISEYRPRPQPEAFHRLKTLPGEQAQIDWAHCGKFTVGNAQRTLMAFVMVLSWSRRIFLRFYPDAKMSSFLHGHVTAFNHWQGVPRVCLYDNLRSAVLERHGDAIRFHPTLLECAGHYRYEPRPVAVYRGNEKGRVERAIRYIRSSFFAARSWRDIDDLNEQADQWCEGQSSDRPCPEDKNVTVREAFHMERPQLIALPDTSFPCEERVAVRIGKTPYARFDLNDYSIPHAHVKKTLTVVATTQCVRVLDGQQEIASHPRSYDKGQEVENPEHINKLTEAKSNARKYRGQNRLTKSAPSAQELLNKAAHKGDNLGSIINTLLRLLDSYGASELEQAIQEALQCDVPHPNAVQICLERRREKRDLPPPIPVTFTQNEKIDNLTVCPHDLSSYDKLSDSINTDNKG